MLIRAGNVENLRPIAAESPQGLPGRPEDLQRKVGPKLIIAHLPAYKKIVYI